MRTPSHLFSILLILLSVSGCQSEQPDPALSSLFRHWIIDPKPNTGKDCCTDVLMLGDINGDGNQDVVIGAEHAEGVSLVWYQYPTWEKHPVAKGEFTTDGQTVDIDRDGDLDIVVGNYTPGQEVIIWFENVTGTGEGEWIQHPIGKGFAHDLEVGDLDGDGDLDVVTCDKKRVVLWEQVTTDSFQQHIILERKGEGTGLADIDIDGDLDIVFGGTWLENPGSLTKSQWVPHAIAKNWHPDTRVAVVDMNRDGRLDVALSVSEGQGSLSWFESPNDPKTGAWIEHPVEKGTLEGTHSLRIADFDNDGDLDVLAAEMHTSKRKRVLIYRNEGGTFKPALLARSGSHNMKVGDIDNDGDPDIVGKNYAGTGRVIEMWENRSSAAKSWKYISVDSTRPNSQKEKMGLVFTDADRDGFTDLVAGSFLYRNPGGDLQASWHRTELADGVDTFFAVDIDNDKFSDLVGILGTDVVWMESSDGKATSWKVRPIAKLAAKGRTQGYVAADFISGEKPQLAFTRGKNLYVLEIPPHPEKSAWPLHLISTETEEEGLAVGDIDHDGDLDIAAIKSDGEHAVWLENPNSLLTHWNARLIGQSRPWMDRVAVADINGDGNLDVIVTEERQDRSLADSLYWFEAPSDAKTDSWKRHTIARHRSLNSMSVADMDNDGAMDIAVAEHTDQKDKGAEDNLTLIYLNKTRGHRWTPVVVERGPHSSHLGARLVDLDNDGTNEIVSIGWSQYEHVHLWKGPTTPRSK
jgi:hypothetical protein